LAGLLTLAVIGPIQADDKQGGFVPLFNGKDLTGWVNVNCAPSTFFVKGGEIITTGKPTGYLRTVKQYENFIAEFDWMHVNKKEVGNSGFFVWADPLPAVGTPYTRGIEVQVLVNLEKEGYYTSQGDLFSIHGATCKPDRPHPQGWMRCLPSENRCKGGGEWNHYKVVARDGTLKLHVNGKEVSGLSECRPRKGYLALESEGAECHFRNLKIKELPSTNPKPEETAEKARAFRNLYTGLDLAGWKADEEVRRHWQPRDWVLHYGGKGKRLATKEEFGDAEFIIDFRFPKKDSEPCTFFFRGHSYLRVTAKGEFLLTIPEARKYGGILKPAGQWNRLHFVKSRMHRLTVNGKVVAQPECLERDGVHADKGPLVLEPEGEMEFGNLFVRAVKH
jgi:hypothetical protein